MNIGERMKNRRKELKLSADDVAERLGVSRASIYRYEKGDIEKFPIESLIPLSEVLRTTPAVLMGWQDEPENSITYIYDQLEPPRQKYVYGIAEEQLEEQNKIINLSDYIEEDLYGYASAGTGQQVFENPIESIRLHKSEIPTQHYDITLKVVGDSMEPAFKDGEYIFIKKTDKLRNGQFGVFIINGESYLKKVYVEDDHLRLVSLNDKYEDLIFTADDGITLIGQVVLKKYTHRSPASFGECYLYLLMEIFKYKYIIS